MVIKQIFEGNCERLTFRDIHIILKLIMKRTFKNEFFYFYKKGIKDKKINIIYTIPLSKVLIIYDLFKIKNEILG